MKKKVFPILILILLFIIPNIAQAGFGISPPYVKTTQLLPGSKYEQTITLLRSSAEDELVADIAIDAPEIKPWITIDKGTQFIMPKNELQVPMKVTVSPPANAELGNYTGYINVRVAPKDSGQGGGVAIALGARIDVAITLTNEAAPDFKVRTVSIPSLEMPKAPWNWPILRWLVYRIKANINLENIGNVKTAPSKVTLEVFDISEKNSLALMTDKSIEKIEPYAVKEVAAEFPTKLGAGDYWGRVKIYKNNEVLTSYKIAFRIAPPGTYPAGRIKLGIWPYVVYGGTGLILLLLLAAVARFGVWKLPVKLAVIILTYTILLPWKLLGKSGEKLNKKFWKWMKDRASKYDD